MKLIAFLIISILTLSASGQEKELKGKIGNVSVNSTPKKLEKLDVDSPLKVINLETTKPERQPAYFIDGKHFSETIIKTINPQSIDSLFVVKEEITIEDKKYYGQIHIKMKEDYKPEIISLADLKTKYTKQSDIPSIFIIDNDIVKSDYNEFLVDEKYVLKIEVQKIENENLNVNVIRLITKTEENLKKANEIRIRGVDTAMLN